MTLSGAVRPPVVIGIGGNVGTDAQLIARFSAAREALALVGQVRSAPMYRTAPVGPAQPAFLNTAVSVTAEKLEPHELGELLLTLQALEGLLGRHHTPEARWGPRTIDLDILVWGDRVISMPDLEVPHPRLAARRFALAPLAALAPTLEVPGLGPVAALLAAVASQQVEQLSNTW